MKVFGTSRLPTFPALPHFAEISDIAALKFWQLEQMPKPSTMVVRRNKLALSLIRKIGTEGRGVSVEKHGQSNATDRPPTPCEIATTYAELRTPISDGALGLFRLERHPTNLYRLIAVVGRSEAALAGILAAHGRPAQINAVSFEPIKQRNRDIIRT